MLELMRRSTLDPKTDEDALPELRPIVDHEKRQRKVCKALERMRR
jgi:hypothetical protein